MLCIIVYVCFSRCYYRWWIKIGLLLRMIAAVSYAVDQNSAFSGSIRTTESYFNDLVGHASLLWFAFCIVVLWPSLLWPSLFVAIMDLAVIVLRVAVMDLFWGRYRLWPSLLWPSLLWPSLFVAIMDLAVIVFHVAVMVCGRHSRSPNWRWRPVCKL